MKILITGATGFIGSNFIQQFPDHQFIVLARDIDRAKQMLGNKHKYYSNLQQISPDESIEAIINLAGEPIANKRWSATQQNKIETSRWQTTQDLVSWIKHAHTKPLCFISGSAIGFYGTSLDRAFTETDVEGEDFSSHLCRKWEDIAMSADDSTRVVLLRTGVVLAANAGALKKMTLPFKLGLGGVIGSGQQWMSWIHIEDYLNALELLLQDESCHGPFNLTAPEPARNSVFVKALASSLNRPALFPMPAFAMKLALGEASTLVLDGQKVLPQKLLEKGFSFRFDNISAALNKVFEVA